MLSGALPYTFTPATQLSRVPKVLKIPPPLTVAVLSWMLLLPLRVTDPPPTATPPPLTVAMLLWMLLLSLRVSDPPPARLMPAPVGAVFPLTLAVSLKVIVPSLFIIPPPKLLAVLLATMLDPLNTKSVEISRRCRRRLMLGCRRSGSR